MNGWYCHASGIHVCAGIVRYRIQSNREENEMLFQELGKLKQSSIMASILLAGLGILMILCPQQM